MRWTAWLLVGIAGCGPTGDERVWQADVRGMQSVMRTVWLGLDPGHVSDVPPELRQEIPDEGTVDCPDGGSINHEGGVITFSACSAGGTILDGALRRSDGPPQIFQYDGFSQRSATDPDAVPSTIDGGYTTTDTPDGRTQVQVDITTTGDDVDYDGRYTSRHSGTITFDPETGEASGNLDIDRESEFGFDTPTRCQFEGVPIETLLDANGSFDGDTWERSCPQPYLDEVRVTLLLKHTNDLEPDMNIHIAREGESFDGTNRVSYRGTKRRVETTEPGTVFVMTAGRSAFGELARTECPPA